MVWNCTIVSDSERPGIAWSGLLDLQSFVVIRLNGDELYDMYALQIQHGPFSTPVYFAHLNDFVRTSNMRCHIGRRAAAAVEPRSLVLNNDASKLERVSTIACRASIVDG